MRFIITPAATVSKLKKAAKLASRNTGVVHAEALDMVARQAGYNHWKHVTECAEHTASDGKAALQRTARDFAKEHQPLKTQSFTVLLGPTGSGKSIHALDAALNSLRDGAPVDIIDVGRTYWTLCQAIRGSYIEVEDLKTAVDGESNNQDSSDFRVFELEGGMPG